MPLDTDIPHSGITYHIIGAAMRVHNRLGAGLKEQHYQRALTAEMLDAGLAVSEEHHLEIYDGEVWLGRLYMDHLVEECVIVEDKGFSHMLTDEDVAQVIGYLAATGLRVGLLLNFGRRRLEHRRILPPKKLDGCQDRVRRYVWQPPGQQEK